LEVVVRVVEVIRKVLEVVDRASESNQSRHRLVVLVEEVVVSRRRRGTGDDIDGQSWCAGTNGEQYQFSDVKTKLVTTYNS
jgi:hypothetical protein